MSKLIKIALGAAMAAFVAFPAWADDLSLCLDKQVEVYYSAANRESCVSSSELIKPTDAMILAESGDQHAGCFRTNVARARW
jgi:hypothetical protein